jgi:hypothetical protein
VAGQGWQQGRRPAQADVTIDATAIPWLLLSRASTTAGPYGGRLMDTTFIESIATTSGLAPSPAERDATTAGAVREIPYTTDFHFWKASARG